MKVTTTLGLALLVTLPLAPGCKSKLDKCNDVCTKMLDEDKAKCGGDDGCVTSAEEKNEACLSLCDSAVGEGNKRASGDDENDDGKSKLDRLREGCEKGKGKDCSTLAAMYLKGRVGTPQSDTKCAEYLEKACNAGEAEGCELYGKMLRDGRGVAKADPEKAQQLFEKACNNKAYGACTSLGLAAMKGGDDKKGVELLTKACDGNDQLGCMGLGGLYLHGNGVTKDVAKAKTLLTKACKLGAKSACDKVETL